MKKNVSIIGGEDGPTSVFIAGKTGVRKNLKREIRRKVFAWRKAKAEKMIVADPRTLDEVTVYLQKKYGMTEIPQSERRYQVQKKHLKEALIMRYRPELLGDLADVTPPVELTEESARMFGERLDARTRKANAITEEEFPLDYHIFEGKVENEGTIFFDVEKNWGILSYNYSGDKKKMKKIAEMAKDILLYYGVSKEDILNRTERYQALVLCLASS